MKKKKKKNGRMNKNVRTKEFKIFIKTENVHMYILLMQTRTVTYYLTDRSCLQGERPTINKSQLS
jgi:hypothetical protein